MDNVVDKQLPIDNNGESLLIFLHSSNEEKNGYCSSWLAGLSCLQILQLGNKMKDPDALDVIREKQNNINRWEIERASIEQDLDFDRIEDQKEIENLEMPEEKTDHPMDGYRDPWQ